MAYTLMFCFSLIACEPQGRFDSFLACHSAGERILENSKRGWRTFYCRRTESPDVK